MKNAVKNIDDFVTRFGSMRDLLRDVLVELAVVRTRRKNLLAAGVPEHLLGDPFNTQPLLPQIFSKNHKDWGAN